MKNKSLVIKTSIGFFLISILFYLMMFGNYPVESTPKYKRIIRLWHHFNQPEELRMLKKYLMQFNEKFPDVKVETLSFEFYAYRKALGDYLNTKKSPDIILAPNDWLGEFVDKGLIQNLTALNYDYNSALPICKEQAKLNNVYYGLPFLTETIALYYNRKLIQTPPKTLDELVASMKIIKSKKLVPIAWDMASAYYLLPWYFGFGGKLNIKNNAMTIDKAAFVQTLNFWMDTDNKNKLTMPMMKYDYRQMINYFAAGSLAYMINGPWCLGDLKTSRVNFGIASLPKISSTGLDVSPLIGTQMFCLASRTKFDEQIKELLKILVCPEFQIEFAKNLGRLPANQNAYKAFDKKKEWIISGFYEQIQKGKSMPSGSTMQKLWDNLSTDNLSKVLSKKETVQQFLDHHKDFIK